VAPIRVEQEQGDQIGIFAKWAQYYIPTCCVQTMETDDVLIAHGCVSHRLYVATNNFCFFGVGVGVGVTSAFYG
jgi:hypothetical protein